MSKLTRERSSRIADLIISSLTGEAGRDEAEITDLLRALLAVTEGGRPETVLRPEGCVGADATIRAFKHDIQHARRRESIRLLEEAEREYIAAHGWKPAHEVPEEKLPADHWWPPPGYSREPRRDVNGVLFKRYDLRHAVNSQRQHHRRPENASPNPERDIFSDVDE